MPVAVYNPGIASARFGGLRVGVFFGPACFLRFKLSALCFAVLCLAVSTAVRSQAKAISLYTYKKVVCRCDVHEQRTRLQSL